MSLLCEGVDRNHATKSREIRIASHRAKAKGVRGLEMIVIDSTKPAINAPESSPFASSMSNRDELDVVII